MRLRNRFPTFPAAVALAAGLVCLGPAAASAAQPADFQGFLDAFGIKHIDKNVFKGSDDPYTLQFYIGYTEPDIENIPSGGLAIFGAFDSGEIVTMGGADYLPNLSEAHYSREIYPPGALLQASETPRYLMLCVFPKEEEGQSHDPIFRAYAERDDANSGIDKSQKAFWSVSVKWRPIPTRRGQSKFSDQDYCEEFSRTKVSSAPLWLPEAGYK